ncbi:hypothetical protein N864_23540 [Intrasporangium chromatireducens Q5-1]|uniref:PspA-associated domain-containing protein n=1 Tax=Intrasporangium chromatireducens Q5-1 TaxID=584657 RepID=W9GSD9_9MICO|nr:hypothetical protein [Intrasporangium chromatireducens]EWT07743.1 hypothetical protein N864_23540 [Intrasporangium chromatireducens Q5-1]
MIIRILGEGQLNVPDQHEAELNRLDDAVTAAVTAAQEMAYQQSLAQLLARVRAIGTPLPDDELTASDAILPAEDTSLAEVRALLGEQGLIPG